jgi:hypothetical protein
MTYSPWQDPSGTKVTVISGMPLVGKTTYVRQHATPGDLILDVDWLFAALSGQKLHVNTESLIPFVASARDAVYERLFRKSEVDRAWIVTSKHDAAVQIVRRFGAKHISIPPISTDELLRRKADRDKQNVWPGLLTL